MTGLALVMEGEARGITLGLRDSGVTVARAAGGGQNLHLIPPTPWLRDPPLYHLVQRLGRAYSGSVVMRSDGRVVILAACPAPATVLDDVEAMITEGRPGGLPDGQYGAWRVSRALDALAYLVEAPRARGGIQGLPRGLEREGSCFRVPYEYEGALAALLERVSKPEPPPVPRAPATPSLRAAGTEEQQRRLRALNGGLDLPAPDAAATSARDTALHEQWNRDAQRRRRLRDLGGDPDLLAPGGSAGGEPWQPSGTPAEQPPATLLHLLAHLGGSALFRPEHYPSPEIMNRQPEPHLEPLTPSVLVDAGGGVWGGLAWQEWEDEGPRAVLARRWRITWRASRSSDPWRAPEPFFVEGTRAEAVAAALSAWAAQRAAEASH